MIRVKAGVTELKMLRFCLGVMKMDRIWIEHLRRTAQLRKTKLEKPDQDGFDMCRGRIYW